jgi:hypothetical protein
MSLNIAFQYVKDVLTEDGPSTEAQLNEQLPRFGSDRLGTILAWALANESLILDGGRYELTERGRR